MYVIAIGSWQSVPERADGQGEEPLAEGEWPWPGVEDSAGKEPWAELVP